LATSFDFSNVESLNLSSGGLLPFDHLIPFPTSLISLTLKRDILSTVGLGNALPCVLPNLTTLRLLGTRIQGPFRNYFKVPRLRHLCISSVSSYPPEKSNRFGYQTDSSAPFDVIFDPPFFQGIPDLESLAIKSTTVEPHVPSNLQVCSQLQRLDLHYGAINESIFSFIEHFLDVASSPSLKTFTITCREWPQRYPMSYSDLIRHRAAQRPHLNVFGKIRGM
jgi:hypothetical protein